MTPADVLRAARAVVASGWTQGAFARNAKGEPLGRDEVRATDACAWCARGAVGVAADEIAANWRVVDIAEDALQRVAERAGADCIAEWNDRSSTTLDTVLAAFDAAIAEVTT